MIRFSHSPSSEEIADSLGLTPEEVQKQLENKSIMLARSGSDWVLMKKQQMNIQGSAASNNPVQKQPEAIKPLPKQPEITEPLQEQPQAPEPLQEQPQAPEPSQEQPQASEPSQEQPQASEPSQEQFETEEHTQERNEIPEQKKKENLLQKVKEKLPNVNNKLLIIVSVVAITIVVAVIGTMIILSSVQKNREAEAVKAITGGIETIRNAVSKLEDVQKQIEDQWEYEGDAPASPKADISLQYPQFEVFLGKTNELLTEYQDSEAANSDSYQQLLLLRAKFENAINAVYTATGSSTPEDYSQKATDAIQTLKNALK